MTSDRLGIVAARGYSSVDWSRVRTILEDAGQWGELRTFNVRRGEYYASLSGRVSSDTPRGFVLVHLLLT